jgi:transposase
MRVEETREAFVRMIEERGVYKKLGVSHSTVATWKIYLEQGASLSLDKMEEMLKKGGAAVAQGKVWDLPD